MCKFHRDYQITTNYKKIPHCALLAYVSLHMAGNKAKSTSNDYTTFAVRSLTPQLSCNALYCISYFITSSVMCDDGDVRLVNDSGGEGVANGRVELCQSNTWGTVCDQNWKKEDMIVVCKQLGFQNLDCESSSI